MCSWELRYQQRNFCPFDVLERARKMDLSISDSSPNVAYLRTITVFSGVPEEELNTIAEKCTLTWHTKGQTIWKQGDKNFGIHFVILGAVQASYTSQAGKVVFLRDLAPGTGFGETGVFDNERSQATWTTRDKTLVASFAAADFCEIATHNPRIAEAVMNSFAVRVRSLLNRVVELGSLGVNNRIHSELLRLGRKNPSSQNKAIIKPPPTHADFAFHVNCAREAVTRELNHLKTLGVIRVEQSELGIEDIARLEKMVDSASR